MCNDNLIFSLAPDTIDDLTARNLRSSISCLQVDIDRLEDMEELEPHQKRDLQDDYKYKLALTIALEYFEVPS